MEIRIGKSTRVCARTQQTFEHGQELLSLVRQGEEGLVREDYTKEAWEPGCADGAIAVWATSYVDPDNHTQETEDAFSPLRNLFYESVESEDRTDLAKAYLAAQLLRRQKVFRLIKEGEESETDSKFALYTDRIGDRMIEVRDPNLSYAELNAARGSLMESLNALEEPEAPEAGEEEAVEDQEELEVATPSDE